MRTLYVFNFAFIAAINIVFGLLEPRIDNFAHWGGLVGGAFAGLLLPPLNRGGVRRELFRVAGVLLAIVLAAAAVDAVKNARAGMYPEKIPPLKEVEGPEGAWYADVPVFWELAETEEDGAVLQDPFGATLTVATVDGGDGNRAFGKNWKLRHERRRLGPRFYVELSRVMLRNGEKVYRRLFYTIEGNHAYFILFECEPCDAYLYRTLFEIITASFRPGIVRQDAPGKHPPTPRPAEAGLPTATSDRICPASGRACARRS